MFSSYPPFAGSSPQRKMCVCESISPGSTVAEERSTTAAPAGICAEPSATFSIRWPRTKINWFFRGAPPVPSINAPARMTVTRSAKLLAVVICLLLPCICSAQRSGSKPVAGQPQAGQIHCAHGEGYAYLYSSMATMEIGTTLKCGQSLSILDRSDNFLHVRTDTGEDGFVPAGNVIFVKPGTVVRAPATPSKRELTPYHDPARPASAGPARPPRNEIILPRRTPVPPKLSRALSSATAHVGEEGTFE